jgi:hypothetical protein
VGFDQPEKLLIKFFFALVTGGKMEVQWALFIDFKKAYDLVRREVLINILVEFGVPMKLVGLIKIYLNETSIKVCIGKHLSDSFPIQNSLQHGDALSPLLFSGTEWN